MARSKDRSEIEYYKGEIRKLKAEIKKLRRHLSEQKRYIPEAEIDDSVLEKDVEEINKIETCPECITGELITVDLNIKFLDKCRNCNYVRTRKK